MDLEMLVYSPLMEEESQDVTGWEKDTVELCQRERGKIYSQIRGQAKILGKMNLAHSDLEDIYEDLLIYLYHSDDYNIAKAIERSKTDQIVSIDGYISICVKYCVARFLSSQFKENKMVVHDTVSTDSDGKEHDLLSNVPDSSSLDEMDTMMYDLETLCRAYEGQRYQGQDTDIYQIMFIKLLTEGKREGLYSKVLEILDISKKELGNVRTSDNNEIMLAFAHAIRICGADRAREILRKYVFGANQIEKTILSIA